MGTICVWKFEEKMRKLNPSKRIHKPNYIIQRYNKCKVKARLSAMPFLLHTWPCSPKEEAIGEIIFKYRLLVNGIQSSGMLWWCPCSYTLKRISEKTREIQEKKMLVHIMFYDLHISLTRTRFSIYASFFGEPRVFSNRVIET